MMTHKSRKKISSAVLLFLLVAVLGTQIPNVNSAISTIQEKALSTIQNVAGLDLSRYDVQLNQYTLVDPKMTPDQGKALGSSTDEIVNYNMKSAEKTIAIRFEYINKTLLRCDFNSGQGASLSDLRLPSDYIEAAKSTLQRLQNDSGRPYIQPMLDMLSNFTQIKDTQLLSDNISFELKTDAYHNTEFTWQYTSNGVDYPRVLDLLFKNGNLAIISDSWNLNTVGSDKVNLSREEAIRIAQEQATKNATLVTFSDGEVVQFNITSVIDAKLSTANREPFTAYPFWTVELSTDVYRNLDMIQVGIWADTGTIAYCQPSGYYGNLEALTSPMPKTTPLQTASTPAATSANDTAFNTFLVVGITAAAIAITATAVAIKTRKR
jgi:hypothetical protein